MKLSPFGHRPYATPMTEHVQPTATLSDRLERMVPSATIAMSQRAREMRESGLDVIALSAGEPDMPVPSHIAEATVHALAEGQTGYTRVDGTTHLKQAIVRKFARDNGLDFTTAQINVSPGGKAVIANAFAATLSPGDEVIVPTPAWVSYTEMVKLFDGTPVRVPGGSDFKITPEALSEAITPRTRWLLINSPGNPSGAVYTAAELRALGKVLLSHPQVMVLSDDIYEHVRFVDDFATLAAAVPELGLRTLTMNGLSKAYSMTGFRIGYAGGPKWLIDAMRKVMGQTTSCASSLSQAAGVAALDGPQDCLDERRATYRARRDRVVARLNTLPGVSCAVPDGAFYAFFRVGGDDVRWCERALTEAHVALVPGSAFHAPGHVRLSYASGLDVLDTALDRLEAWLLRERD